MKAKKASITGIIHSIMLLVDCCLASAVGIVVIFCWAQVEIPTRMGRIGVGSGFARSSPKKMEFRGMAVSATGFHEYRRWESPTRSSGLVPRLFRSAWYSPIHMGSCTTIGPRQPRGFTPASR